MADNGSAGNGNGTGSTGGSGDNRYAAQWGQGAQGAQGDQGVQGTQNGREPSRPAYPGQSYPSLSAPAGTAATPGSRGNPGVAATAVQPDVPDSAATTTKSPRRFSTPVVAGMVVAVGIAASAVTGVIMNNTGSGGSSDGTTFSTQVVGDREQTSSTPDDGTIEGVADKVLPSVVSIQVTSGQSGAEGSGSIISSDGMILTNNHVVAEADGRDSQMTVTTNDGKQYEAEVVATDPQTDIAVIQARDASDLTPITIGDPDSVAVGQSVVAVGSPLGLSSTVTTGIVSAKDRPVQAGGESGGEASLIDAIQTDAAINPGNSGGALVNLNGELVGIPSVIATLGGTGEESGSIGLGFAIPADQAMDTAKQLIDTGKATHPVIGAQVDTRETTTGGAVIAEVTGGGPAEEAGLKSGDVVTKVDDRLVDNGVSLIAAIRSHNVGDEVTLTVTDGHGGNEHEIKVTLSASE
ncbi:MAG: S1C family serine protease [Corynebacterium variabile]